MNDKMRICARCGRPFSGGTNERFCKACTVTLLRGDSKKQEAVRNFIRDNQGVTDRKVMEKFGVSKKFVNQMITNKTVANKNTDVKTQYPCANCGKMITEGVYCSECFLLLRKEIQKYSAQMAYLKNLMSRKNLAPKLQAENKNPEPTATETAEKVVDYDFDMKYKILLVEDKADDMQKEILTLEYVFPCTITTAKNGIEALYLLSDPNFETDVVLVSLEMPFMDGFEFLAFVAKDEHMRRFPVIMMTTSTDINTLSKIKNSIAKGYIRKPNFSAEGLEMIAKVLEG